MKPVREVFYTYNNGTRPFKVVVEDGKISIFSELKDSEGLYNPNVLFIAKPQTIMIGTDPRNPDYDGNSILLHLHSDVYVFVGYRIFQFQSLSPITHFWSRMGNSDNYPYAVTENNDIIFFMEDAVMKGVATKETKNAKHNPYVDFLWKDETRLLGFYVYVNNERYEVSYQPHPISHYNALTEDGTLLVYFGDEIKNRKPLSLSDYKVRMEVHAKEHGLSTLLFDWLIPESN
jgi:hypothetical protein